MARRKTSTTRSSRRRSAPLSGRGLLLVLALVALVYLWREGYIQRWLGGNGLPVPGAPPAATAPPIASGDGSIQAFFTTPSLVYPDVVKNRVAPPYETALIADIDAAKQSVDIATFEYNLDSVAAALLRAKQRGLSVRLALDRENLDKPAMAKWAGQVEKGGIPISWERTDAFLHSKFVIVDNNLVWMGSWNVTTNDTYRNNNNLLRITIPAIVANYHFEFEQMFAGHFDKSKASPPNHEVQAGAVRLENYFSPEDRQQQAIVKRIDAAQKSVHFMAFSFTADAIADALVAREKSGVAVQGVMESRNAQGLGSELPKLKQAGIDALEDGNCYTMHHKVIIIDDQTVITGSYNFTGRAEDVNDENFLIIDDPALAKQFNEEFARVYAQAQNPPRCQS